MTFETVPFLADCRIFAHSRLNPPTKKIYFVRNTNFFGFISSRLGTIQWYVPRVNWYLFVLGFAFNSGLINFVLFSCYFRVNFVINSLVHSLVRVHSFTRSLNFIVTNLDPFYSFILLQCWIFVSAYLIQILPTTVCIAINKTHYIVAFIINSRW